MKKTLVLTIITLSMYGVQLAHATTYFDTRPLFTSVSSPTQDLVAVNPQGAFDYIRVGTLSQPISATDLYVTFSVPTSNSCAKLNTFGGGVFQVNFDLQPFTDASLQTPLTGNSADTAFGIRTLPDGTCVAKFDNITLASGSYVVLAFGLLPQYSDRLNPWPLTVTAGGTWESVPPFCPGGIGINNCIAYSGTPYVLITDENPFPEPPVPGPPPLEPSAMQLTNFPGETAKHPNWSPKGDFISYISNRGSGNGRMNDVWAVAPDGSNAHQLTAMPDDGFEGGTFEAFWIGSTGDLVLVDVNILYEWLHLQLSTNPPLPVARTAFDGPSPNYQELLTIPGGLGGLSFAVSRDGQFAAWSEMITPSSSCPWVTNAAVAPFAALNGQTTTSVGSVIATASVACTGIPKSEAIVGISFSPDNSQVVLARASDPNVIGYDLEVYKTNGQFVRKLTNNGTGTSPVINWNPSWSSDGHIAFGSNQTGRFEIYTINPDGSNLKPVTTNGGDWPSWSPDSSKIAFQSTRSGNSEIYAIPVTSKCSLSSVLLDKSLSNGVMDATITGSPCEAQLIIENKQVYWTNFTVSTVGFVTAKPVGGDSNLYARFGLLPPSGLLPLPPGKSVSYALRFSQPGASVTIFADPTVATGLGAGEMNILQSVLNVLPLGGLPILVIDDYQKISEGFVGMPDLQNSVSMLFQNPPNFPRATQDFVAFLRSQSEITALRNLSQQLGLNIADAVLKSLLRSPGRILNSLVTIFGEFRAALFAYPSGSLLVEAH